MSEQHDPRPSFRVTRIKHNISLGQLLEELDAAGVLESLEISFDTLQLLDLIGLGRPEVIDAALAALSRLAGQQYDRANVGRFGFLPSASHNGESVTE
jgi:hypothetical protein